MSHASMLIGLLTDPAPLIDAAPDHDKLTVEGWTALCLTLDPSDLAQEDRVLELAATQNAVLAAYVAQTDVLPVALGAVFSGPHALLDHIRQNRALWEIETGRLRGLCEYSLHISENGTSGSPPDANSEFLTGKDFLRVRQNQRDARATKSADRSRFVKSLLSVIRRQSTDLADVSRPGAGRLMDIAFLLHRDRVNRLIADIGACAAEASRLDLKCRLVGPCPAYSFVRMEGGDA